MDAIRVPWEVEAAREPFLHPGRGARVLAAGEPAGWLGELHPAVAARWDLDQAAGFELDFGSGFGSVGSCCGGELGRAVAEA